MFAFTSPRAKVDNNYNNCHGPPNLRMQGQTYHKIGSPLPLAGHVPKFSQFYIYHTRNEIHYSNLIE